MLRLVAKHYQMPLTDPRLLDYTDELLMIEFAFLKEEHPDWFGGEDKFIDPNYEAWEQQAMEEDRKLYIPNENTRNETVSATKQSKGEINLDDDEWEDVPIEQIEDDPLPSI